MADVLKTLKIYKDRKIHFIKMSVSLKLTSWGSGRDGTLGLYEPTWMKQNFSHYYHSSPNLKTVTKEYSQLTSNDKDPIIKNTDFSPWVKIYKGEKSFRFLSPPGKTKKGKIHKHH